jgi:putative ABC transport system permease protein
MTENRSQFSIGRQIEMPLSKAVAISYNSIRIRFWRSMITAGGTFLGIAFLVSVLLSALIEQHTPGAFVDPIVLAAAKNRQLWLAIVSLVVCTVGITNSMLMSVTERFREIGTMKCLGALDKFVVELFLLESLMLGITASFAGWLVGSLVTIVAGSFSAGWGAVAQVGYLPIFRILGISVGL